MDWKGIPVLEQILVDLRSQSEKDYETVGQPNYTLATSVDVWIERPQLIA